MAPSCYPHLLLLFPVCLMWKCRQVLLEIVRSWLLTKVVVFQLWSQTRVAKVNSERYSWCEDPTVQTPACRLRWVMSALATNMFDNHSRRNACDCDIWMKDNLSKALVVLLSELPRWKHERLDHSCYILCHQKTFLSACLLFAFLSSCLVQLDTCTWFQELSQGLLIQTLARIP